MTAYELREWQWELSDAYWANLIGDTTYAEQKMLDIIRRYVYGKEPEEYQQATKEGAKGSNTAFRRRNSDTD